MSDLNALNYIAGQWQGAAGGATGESRNPADGSIIGTYAASGADDARLAIASARDAFDTSLWAHDARLRQMVLLQWADRLEQRQELASLLTQENGKVLAQSRGEMAAAISEIRYYAGLTRHIPGHFMEVEPGAYSATLREAAGVAGLSRCRAACSTWCWSAAARRRKSWWRPARSTCSASPART
jgi:acyl-CoA reductase-like NAD-dependent aldehyde dehydrogenase